MKRKIYFHVNNFFFMKRIQPKPKIVEDNPTFYRAMAHRKDDY